jgi:membrane-associated phospholipid phosphatase
LKTKPKYLVCVPTNHTHLKKSLVSLARNIALLSVIILSGCGTLSNGHRWGEDATLLPGWDRIGKAAYNAAVAPETWVPAAGALAFQIGNADHVVSHWAIKNTPVYGSNKGADNASNILLDSMKVLYGLSFLATPSGDDPLQWGTSKFKAGLVQGSAILMVDDGSLLLKKETGRLRPESLNDDASFPSNHASRAAVFGTLASQNVDQLNISPGMKQSSQWGFGMMTAATGWARVEAGSHYPADVLAGAAFGHFLASFFNEAFLGLNSSSPIVPQIEPSKQGLVVGIKMQF